MPVRGDSATVSLSLRPGGGRRRRAATPPGSVPDESLTLSHGPGVGSPRPTGTVTVIMTLSHHHPWQ